VRPLLRTAELVLHFFCCITSTCIYIDLKPFSFHQCCLHSCFHLHCIRLQNPRGVHWQISRQSIRRAGGDWLAFFHGLESVPKTPKMCTHLLKLGVPDQLHSLLSSRGITITINSATFCLHGTLDFLGKVWFWALACSSQLNFHTITSPNMNCAI
jgi:hypothetical protein